MRVILPKAVEEKLNTTRVSNFFIEIRVVSYAENLDLLGFSVFLYFHAVFVVPSRFMRKIVCRLRLNEVSRQ